LATGALSGLRSGSLQWCPSHLAGFEGHFTAGQGKQGRNGLLREGDKERRKGEG